jgi:hypothetical protein
MAYERPKVGSYVVAIKDVDADLHRTLKKGKREDDDILIQVLPDGRPPSFYGWRPDEWQRSVHILNFFIIGSPIELGGE